MSLFDDELRRLQQIKARNDALEQAQLAEQNYNNQMAQAQANLDMAQSRPSNPLESVLSGIGNSIANVGKTLVDIPGTTIANWIDLAQGKNLNAEGSNTQEWKKSLYGGENAKDRYAKTAGTALDAAATVSDLIPGIGTAGKVALNVGQGVASGAAQNYIDNGANASLEDTLKGAGIGAASAGVGQLVGGKLASKTAGNGAISKALNSNIGKAAITGAASGATGGALGSSLNGGDLGQSLSAALQGAQGGALGGAAMAGTMGLVGAGLDKAKNKLGVADQTQAVQPVQAIEQTDVENAQKGNMFGRALKNAGNDLEAAQTNITRAERRKYGIKDAGATVDNLRKRTGFSNIDDQANFAKNITGGPDSVMDTIQRYNISVDESGKPITLRTDQYEVAVNDAVGKNWKKTVMGESYDQFRNDLISDIQNEDPISAANNLKSSASKYRAAYELNKDPKDATRAKIYTDVADSIDNLSYSAVPQSRVNQMFDDTIDEFYTRAQEAKAAGNKKYATAYDKLAKELEGTERTIANYRHFKQDFVKSSQLAEISRGAQSGSLEAGYKRGNIVGRFVNTIVEEPVNRVLAWGGGKLNDLGDAVNGVNTSAAGKVAGGVGKAVGGLASALANDNIANVEIPVTLKGNTQTVGDVLARQVARQAGLGAERTRENQATLQEAQQQMQNAQNEYDSAMDQAQTAYANAQAMAEPEMTAGQQQLDRIARAMDLALNAGDLKSYSELASLYKTAYSMYGADTAAAAQGGTAKAEKLTDNQAKALTGLQQLEQLSQMKPTAATALKKTPLAGLVDMTGGDEYSNQAQSLALTLGYLQSGANVSENEAMRIGTSYIPNALDSEATRQGKLERARALLNNYLYGTQYYQQ